MKVDRKWLFLKSRYYILNRKADYIHGYKEDIVFKEGSGLTIKEGSTSGVFYSSVFDSLDKQTIWYKLTVDADIPNNTTIRLTFFANDEPYILDANGEKLDIYYIVRSLDIPVYEKDALFKSCSTETIINPEEEVFRTLKGRYFWFKAEFFAQHSVLPSIKTVKAYIKGKHWIEYLPEIYRQNTKSASFTERYLSIFQSLYEDMETKIDNLDVLFNPDVANREFLEWISSWVGINDCYMWNDAQLRYLLKNIVSIYKIFGTKESISKMVELYTGELPIVVESNSLYDKSLDHNTKLLYQKLYDSSPFVFTVLIKSDTIKSNAQYETLLKIIDSVKPAHMEVNLIVLQPVILLDGYSYMGINTELSELSSITLDGNSSLYFTVL